MNDIPEHGVTPDLVRTVPGGNTVTQGDIDRAVESVRGIAGWHVWPERDDTIVVDSPGDDVLILPTQKVRSVSAVRINGQDVDMSGVQWSADGILCRPAGFPRGFRSVEVDLVHGYADAPDLVGVVGLMAVRAASPQGSLTVGGISTGGGNGLTPQSSEWRVLRRYELGPLP